MVGMDPQPGEGGLGTLMVLPTFRCGEGMIRFVAADGSARAVMTALGANLGVAVAKFIAAAITGSAAMLAEGVHSVADSGNQVLLLIGGRRARQAPSALHPFGYARERYIYVFLVAIVLFSLGGLYALYEGYHKIIDPHPLTSPLVAVVVLLIGMILFGPSVRDHAAAGLVERRAGGRRAGVRSPFRSGQMGLARLGLLPAGRAAAVAWQLCEGRGELP
jgi:hypothetical protein